MLLIFLKRVVCSYYDLIGSTDGSKVYGMLVGMDSVFLYRLVILIYLCACYIQEAMSRNIERDEGIYE